MISLDTLRIIISVIWVLSEIILNIVRRIENGRKDKVSFQMIFIVIFISIFFGALIYVYCKLNNMKLFYLPDIFIILGLILIIIGISIRWTAILTLKQFFSVNVTITQNHKIVKSGLYKFIRHPAYTGSLISFLGLGLSFSNWLSLLLIFLPILIIFILRIKAEEELLIKHFGLDYINYRKETKYLIPYII